MSEVKRVIREKDMPWMKYGERKADDDTQFKVLTSYELNGSRDLMFGICKWEPGEKHLMHYHEIESEIYYVLKGRAKITVDDDVIDAEPGTTIYMPPGTKHKVVNDGDETCVCIWLYNFPGYPEKITYKWLEGKSAPA